MLALSALTSSSHGFKWAQGLLRFTSFSSSVNLSFTVVAVCILLPEGLSFVVGFFLVYTLPVFADTVGK